jgi:hypothetical protein
VNPGRLSFIWRRSIFLYVERLLHYLPGDLNKTTHYYVTYVMMLLALLISRVLINRHCSVAHNNTIVQYSYYQESYYCSVLCIISCIRLIYCLAIIFILQFYFVHIALLSTAMLYHSPLLAARLVHKKYLLGTKCQRFIRPCRT